jgi:hypothetical protein
MCDPCCLARQGLGVLLVHLTTAPPHPPTLTPYQLLMLLVCYLVSLLAPPPITPSKLLRVSVHVTGYPISWTLHPPWCLLC